MIDLAKILTMGDTPPGSGVPDGSINYSKLALGDFVWSYLHTDWPIGVTYNVFSTAPFGSAPFSTILDPKVYFSAGGGTFYPPLLTEPAYYLLYFDGIFANPDATQRRMYIQFFKDPAQIVFQRDFLLTSQRGLFSAAAIFKFELTDASFRVRLSSDDPDKTSVLWAGSYVVMLRLK